MAETIGERLAAVWARTDRIDGKHFVVKGGSWATATELLRRSFRNWFQAHYPYVFAKFRCVARG
jgi:formylglycine-generating enzyme required for sulfatase activity